MGDYSIRALNGSFCDIKEKVIGKKVIGKR
jgi:hypothetical protein